MTNEENKCLDNAIFDYQREMFGKGEFYQSEMAQYLIQLAFEKCAQWKDKQFTKQKQEWMDKACEWMKNNVPRYLESYGPESSDVCIEKESLINDFRKAME